MKKDFFNDTDIEYLISNLRQEVGEIIQTWVVYQETKSRIKLIEDKIEKEKVYITVKALKNEIINKLSELSEKKKYNQINFELATKKLNQLKSEFEEFEESIKMKNFDIIDTISSVINIIIKILTTLKVNILFLT